MTGQTEPGLTERLAGLVLRTIGRSSDSIRLGFERGFDSGEMMDAIYKDQPSGRWLVGGLVDRIYLDQPGCRGLRARKTALMATIEKEIAAQRADGRRPVIVDVASGPATYLVEVLSKDRAEDLTALARDRDVHALDRGRHLAEAAGIRDRLRYETGDALDDSTLTSLRPSPTMVIASGFYELLLDESVIARSMAIARRMLADGDPLIFTTQVAHPQVALMAVVPAHDGKPWIIRNRSLEVVESLVTEAGFSEVTSTMEPVGIFAVSLAR